MYNASEALPTGKAKNELRKDPAREKVHVMENFELKQLIATHLEKLEALGESL